MLATHDGLVAAIPLRLPAWAARRIDGDAHAAHAGAALALLDAVAGAAVPHAGAWAQRLALSAAAAGLRRLGRPEDEAALRDLVGLEPAPPAGPAAPMARAHLWLAAGPVGDRWAGLPALLAGLGARSGTAPVDLAAALAGAAGASCPLAVVADAVRAAAAIRPGHDALALWAADVALARWLGWPRGLPLVSLGLPAGTPAPDPFPAAEAVLRGAVRALDRCAALGRQAAALQELRPRLRARPAGAVVERLLAHDALSVAGVRDLIPERAARRLFDRLVALGGVRELTGRPAFRLYGL